MTRENNLKHDETAYQAKADYKVAKAHCKELSGNDKDACMKEAKAGGKKCEGWC